MRAGGSAVLLGAAQQMVSEAPHVQISLWPVWLTLWATNVCVCVTESGTFTLSLAVHCSAHEARPTGAGRARGEGAWRLHVAKTFVMGLQILTM